MTLECSPEYLAASPEVRHQVCNGCGPGGWKFDIIPDNLLGLPIHEPCDIHDWDYAFGSTQADKEAADSRFLRNMMDTINNYKGWTRILNHWRRKLALDYYEAVHLAGDSAFWENKGPK
jgi:hypothetical protein